MAKKLNYIKEVFYDSCTRLSTGDGFAIHKKKKQECETIIISFVS